MSEPRTWQDIKQTRLDNLNWRRRNHRSIARNSGMCRVVSRNRKALELELKSQQRAKALFDQAAKVKKAKKQDTLVQKVKGLRDKVTSKLKGIVKGRRGA